MSPNIRLIYIIRNPVDQVWSQTKMWTEKHHESRIDDLSPDEIIKIIQLNWKSFRHHADYLGNLTAWQQHFPSDQIFLAYFDDLQAAQIKFMGSILHFLDLSMPDTIDPIELATPHNARPARPMHDDVRRGVAEQWHDDIVALNDYLEHHHTASWLQQTTAYLNATIQV